MFTGIIEKLGVVKEMNRSQSNLEIVIESELADSLKVDQSVAHNGVCLTVVDIQDKNYKMIAIDETIQLTNIGNWNVGEKVNVERAMQAGARLDGHMVQGHVDAMARVEKVEDQEGSWVFTFSYTINPAKGHLLVDKGSICVNGVSLTVVNPIDNLFSVAIIPYTYENTVFHQLKVGDLVNLEFDIIGKYIAKYGEYFKKL